MLINQINNPSEEIIKEVRNLELICKEYDGLSGNLFLDNSINFDLDIQNLFLLYDDNTLVSLLSMFIPTKAEAEISAYTLPSYRQRGCFKKLLIEAINELKKYNVLDMLFVCQPQSLAGKEGLKKLETDYDFTEYSLCYNNVNAIEKEKCSYSIELYKPKLEDFKTLITIRQEIFNMSYEDVENKVMKISKSNSREQYLVLLNGEFIGTASISFENTEVSIFGVGILQKYQGNGFGKAMLQLIIHDLVQKDIKNITLEVNSKNEKAFNLYKKCGFETKIAFDYYRKSIL